MKINLKKFETILKKGTINFSIETLQLRFNDGRIKSSMISGDGNCISILNVDNDVIETQEELVLNFADVSQNTIPYIQNFDNEEIELQIRDAFMRLIDGSQINKIVFVNDTIVKRFGSDDVQDNVEWFLGLSIDQDFMDKFDKIKRIGARFGKIYITIKDHKVFLETTDKRNMYSNGIKFELDESDKNDLTLCFSYKDMVNLMGIIDIQKNFKAKFTYNDEQDLGMMYMLSEDGSEKYCLLSTEV